MLQVPYSIVRDIEASCTMQNVRGAKDWRSKNDGIGHASNSMQNLVQARKAEWFVWKMLSTNRNITHLTRPNFDRDAKASADLSFKDKNGKRWFVEVKSCDQKKRDRNGYQFQIRRKTSDGVRVVDTYLRTNGAKGGDLLFYCVMVDKNKCTADTVFGMRRKDLVCSMPNRTDLQGLKYAIHPRLQPMGKNLIF